MKEKQTKDKRRKATVRGIGKDDHESYSGMAHHQPLTRSLIEVKLTKHLSTLFFTKSL